MSVETWMQKNLLSSFVDSGSYDLSTIVLAAIHAQSVWNLGFLAVWAFLNAGVIRSIAHP